MTYLLDTNVVSELRRRRPDPGVVEWFAGVDSRDLYLSVLTVGEINNGVESLKRRDPAQADRLRIWLDELETTYGDRILPVTTTVAKLWGALNVPDLLPTVDCLLAATALDRSMTLVTRNTKDVERTGVRLLNPFSG